MIFVIGPLFSGKRTFVKSLFGWDDQQLTQNAVLDAQDLVSTEGDPAELVNRLAEYPAVIAAETGAGVVPVDPAQRMAREKAGRLACLLAERADVVVRMCCGLPQVLKGDPAGIQKGAAPWE